MRVRLLVLPLLLATTACPNPTTIGVNNSPPEAVILEPEDEHEAAEGTALSFRGTVTDRTALPEALSVSWSSSLDGTLCASNPDEDPLPPCTPGTDCLLYTSPSPRD